MYTHFHGSRKSYENSKNRNGLKIVQSKYRAGGCDSGFIPVFIALFNILFTHLLLAISDDFDYEFVGRKCSPNDANSLYRHLGIDQVLVEQIRYDNRDMIFSEVTVAVLQKWYKKNGRDATRNALLSVLKNAGMRDVADNLEIEFTTRKSNR